MKQEILQQMPDWANAPEWAMYRAIDSDGEAYFYAKKPIKNDSQWRFGGFTAKIRKFDPTNWQASLEQRPTQRPEGRRI